MRIAIVGGGWVGCHLAYKLKDKHDVTLFEKNNNLFRETSYNNQNRLHLGFHYARNYKTRKMCKDTFELFIKDYGFITDNVDKNLYCVPQNGSIIDFETYKEIFRSFEKKETFFNLRNTEGCINTNERYINFKKAFEFFNSELNGIIVNEKITEDRIFELSKEFDLVINSTNNFITDKKNDYFFELTLTLLYENIAPIEFNAITMVDGALFSIYPYQDNLFTVTDVEHTPIKKFKNVNELNEYNKDISIDIILAKKYLIEEKICQYYPEFLKDFKYSDYFISTKSKIVSSSDSRYPVIEKTNNIINCFTGKIQGIYIIEDYVNKFL